MTKSVFTLLIFTSVILSEVEGYNNKGYIFHYIQDDKYFNILIFYSWSSSTYWFFDVRWITQTVQESEQYSPIADFLIQKISKKQT